MSLQLPLILASASPHRKRLLESAGFSFEVLLPEEHAEDDRQSGELPIDYVRRLAFQKASNAADRMEQGIVIGGDTIVLCGESILEKPLDRDDARQMLRQLRGQVHHVLSGLCLIKKERHPIGEADNKTILLETDTTRLFMVPISDADLEAYLDTGIWQGKSGSFGYQDCKDWIMILEGSESNVIGLPMELFQRMYDDLGRER